MKRLLKDVLATSQESCDHDDEIVIGAEQSLVTVKDSLAVINENKDVVDESAEELDDLEEVEEALESMASNIRSAIRDGGMTQEVARVQQAALSQLLQKASLEAVTQLSLESFDQDPINVSLEAEKSVKDVAKNVASKIAATAKRLLDEMDTYIKSFSTVSKGLRVHAAALKEKTKGLTKPEEAVTVDVAKAGAQFHIGGRFDGQVEAALTKVISVGDNLLKHSTKAQQAVDVLITSAGKGEYKQGDYADALMKAVNGISQTDLPGGYVLSVSAVNHVILTRDEEEVNESRTIPLPDVKVLNGICDKVVKLADFIEKCNASLIGIEKELKRLIKETESASSSDADAAGSMGALGADLSKILSAVRGAGPDYLRYSAMCGKEALGFVNKCISQYA